MSDQKLTLVTGGTGGSRTGSPRFDWQDPSTWEPALDGAGVYLAVSPDLAFPGVTGPRLLTFGEAVAEIAKATGREVRNLPVTPEAYATALTGYGVPAEYATFLGDLFKSVLDGHNSHLTDGVQRALGRAPRDFADYARDTATTGVWG